MANGSDLSNASLSRLAGWSITLMALNLGRRPIHELPVVSATGADTTQFTLSFRTATATLGLLLELLDQPTKC